MNSIFFGFVFVVGTTLLAIAGFWGIRRVPKFSSGGDDHEIAQSLLSVVGTLFAVLLGFLVSASLNAYSLASNQVNMEANSLADVFRLAKGLPEIERLTIRNSCREYCETVMKEEWPLLDKGETAPKAWTLYYTLWDEVLAVDPANTREADIHSTMLDAITSLGENRRKRAVSCTFHLSPALWIVTISGAVITILFTYLFHARKTWLHSTMVGMVAASLSLNVVLMSVYSSPFAGAMKIQPEAFHLNDVLFAQDDHESPFLERFKSKKSAAKSSTQPD